MRSRFGVIPTHRLRVGSFGHMVDVRNLRDAIQREHHVRCTHIRSERVTATVGKASWDGAVEVFACTDDPSMLVYGWSENSDAAEPRYVTVPGKRPIASARDAVRAHLAECTEKRG
jgi:hypothetical protein